MQKIPVTYSNMYSTNPYSTIIWFLNTKFRAKRSIFSKILSAILDLPFWIQEFSKTDIRFVISDLPNPRIPNLGQKGQFFQKSCPPSWIRHFEFKNFQKPTLDPLSATPITLEFLAFEWSCKILVLSHYEHDDQTKSDSAFDELFSLFFVIPFL